MPCILHIETSSKPCSVAISKGTEIKAFKLINEADFKHAELLHALIELAVNEAQTSIQNIDAVAVSSGPGSYTGLRVGVSAAKGLCYALNKPLLSVLSTQIMAFAALEKHKNIADYKGIITAIDARREEIYCHEFDVCANAVSEPAAIILDETKKVFENYLVCGDGAEKVKKYFGDKNKYVPEIFASAQFMIRPALQKFTSKQLENVAYFEPFYLKEFFTRS